MASGGSVSRARSSAGSRGCQTRATSSPSGSPPAVQRSAARLRLPGSTAAKRSASVSRPAAARSTSVTDGSPFGISSPASSKVQTASRSRPGMAGMRGTIAPVSGRELSPGRTPFVRGARR